MQGETACGLDRSSRARQSLPRTLAVALVTLVTVLSTAPVSSTGQGVAADATTVLPGGLGTFAGGVAPGPTPATSVSLGGQADVSGSTMVVADDVIRRIDLSSGVQTVIAGGGSSEPAEGMVATDAHIVNPVDVVAIGPDGRVAVVWSPYPTFQIWVIEPDGRLHRLVEDVGQSPTDVEYDEAGNLYVAGGFDSTVRKVSPSGSITTVAGSGLVGFSGDGGPATSAMLNLDYDSQLAAAADGSLLIADTGNDRVRRVDAAGMISTVAGGGTATDFGVQATQLQLDAPTGVAALADGAFVVSLPDDGVVAHVGDTGVSSHFAGAGYASDVELLDGEGGPATDAYLAPLALTASGSTVWISVWDGIREVTGGTITTTAGNGDRGLTSGDGGPAVQAQFYRPTGIDRDASGNVYVADWWASRVRRIATDGTITTIAGTGDPGAALGDGGPATEARVNGPVDVAVGPDGSVYISEFGGVASSDDGGAGRVRRVDPSGTISTVAGPADGLGALGGLAVDDQGSVVVADATHQMLLRIDGNSVTAIAGDGTTGFSGDGGPATDAQLNLTSYASATWFPGVDIGPDGAILLADNGNGRVRRIDPDGTITTIAGDGGDDLGDGGPAVDAALPMPVGIDVIGDDIIVAQHFGNRVRRIHEDGTITTIAGNGTLRFSDGRPATAHGLPSPTGLTTMADGSILVASNGRVRIVAPAALPGPPGPPTATAGDQSVQLWWTPPVDDGGSPVTGYAVTASPGGASCAASSWWPSCTVFGLSNGQTYTFTVVATNAVGDGTESEPTEPVVPFSSTTVPDAPTGVSGVAGDGTVSVSWVAPLDDGGSPVTGYAVTASPGGEGCTTTGGTSCTVSGLVNGVGYSFVVVTSNTVGAGPASLPSEVVVPTRCGGSGSGPFIDVPAGHPFCGDIEWLAGRGISTGFPDGSFRPSGSVSRMALASFLWRAAGEPPSELPAAFFDDVGPDHPFFEPIQWMAATGQSTGTPNPGGKPSFNPAGSVSRQAMAAFLFRTAGEPPSLLSVPFFVDVTVDHPFYDAVQWMADAGLSTGTPNPVGKPSFKPSDRVSRQAMAAFLSRYERLDP